MIKINKVHIFQSIVTFNLFFFNVMQGTKYNISRISSLKLNIQIDIS